MTYYIIKYYSKSLNGLAFYMSLERALEFITRNSTGFTGWVLYTCDDRPLGLSLGDMPYGAKEILSSSD